MTDLIKLARDKRASRIRELNDVLRRTFTGGRIMLTAGVAALEPDKQAAVIEALQNCDDSAFDKCNDPYGEHDFIAFEIEEQTYFAKIDYYDLDMQYGSEDPADPEKTTRVLTIMLASEY